MPKFRTDCTNKNRKHADLDIDITIRRPRSLISLEIPRYWHSDGAFATHFLNAFSSTLPFGEAFFVRSVLYYQDRVISRDHLERVRGFSCQEAQHLRVHAEHVDLLLAQGYTGLAIRNRISERAARWLNRRFPLLSLSMTAAFEHLTAILAHRVLSDPHLLIGKMHSDMALLWRWHALEEIEHKAVAFEVLKQVAPGHTKRVLTMVFSTLFLSIELLDRLFYLLWKDRLLFKATTWSSGYQFLFAGRGFLRGLSSNYLLWFRPSFHPDRIDNHSLIDENTRWVNDRISNAIHLDT
ncbi:metal-dependent hydrolase [Pseudomonadota bacterium]